MAPPRRGSPGTGRKIPLVMDRRGPNWIGFTRDIPDRFMHLVNDHNLSDMSFIVGAERVRMPAHKLIIGISSTVLYRLMQNMDPYEPEITIKDINAHVWLIVLMFIYGHSVERLLRTDNVLGCLKCAMRYNLKSLRYHCAVYIRQNLLLLDDNIPVDLLHSVNITEALLLRREIRNSQALSVVTLQWRNHFILAVEGVSCKEVRRLAVMNLRNLDSTLVFYSVISWFRSECQMRKMSQEHRTLRSFFLQRCPRINFPAMTPGQFYRCFERRHDSHLSRDDVEMIRFDARDKRRQAIGSRRRVFGPVVGIAAQNTKAGIYEVALLRNIREIRNTPPDHINRTNFNFSCNRIIVIHGFAVPVLKGTDASMTVVFISNATRLLEKTVSSGLRRVYDATYDFLYLFLRDPILLDPNEVYEMSLRVYDTTCAISGEFHRDVFVNGIKFTFNEFQEPDCHALFLLFEDPRIYADDNALTMLDLVAYVRRPNSDSDSLSDEAEAESRV